MHRPPRHDPVNVRDFVRERKRRDPLLSCTDLARLVHKELGVIVDQKIVWQHIKDMRR